MSDSRKAIHEDENDWNDFVLIAELPSYYESNPYSEKARILKQGYIQGLKGAVLMAYTNKEIEIKKLHADIQEIEDNYLKFLEMYYKFVQADSL